MKKSYKIRRYSIAEAFISFTAMAAFLLLAGILSAITGTV